MLCMTPRCCKLIGTNLEVYIAIASLLCPRLCGFSALPISSIVFVSFPSLQRLFVPDLATNITLFSQESFSLKSCREILIEHRMSERLGGSIAAPIVKAKRPLTNNQGYTCSLRYIRALSLSA